MNKTSITSLSLEEIQERIDFLEHVAILTCSIELEKYQSELEQLKASLDSFESGSNSEKSQQVFSKY